MDRDTAITRVQDGLGFRRTLASTIALRMQEEQRDLERGKTLPKFMLREDQPLVLVENTQEIDLPLDFLRRSNNKLRFTPENTTLTQTIPWLEKDVAYETFGDMKTAGPVAAVLRASTILFFPLANVQYTIVWDYYAKGILLDANVTDSLWLNNAPELIIGGAGLRIAKDIGYAAGIQLFGDMYKQARTTVYAEVLVQESDDGPMRLGSNA